MLIFFKVEGIFYVNKHLKKLMFDELEQFSSAGGSFQLNFFHFTQLEMGSKLC